MAKCSECHRPQITMLLVCSVFRPGLILLYELLLLNILPQTKLKSYHWAIDSFQGSTDNANINEGSVNEKGKGAQGFCRQI